MIMGRLLKNTYFLAMVFVLIFSGLTFGAESRLNQALKRGELIVGTRSTSLPFSYRDEKGEISGFDIDLARELALGLFGDKSKVKFIVFGSGADRIPALMGGRVDIVISQFTILEKRSQKIEFSIPYIKSGLGILVRDDTSLRRNKDLNGKKIAFRQHPYIKKVVLKSIPEAKIDMYPTTADALTAFRQKRADGICIDIPALAYIAKKFGGYRLLEDTLSFEMLGVGIPQGDQILVNYINSSLRQMKWEDRIQAIYRKWFGNIAFAPRWLRSEP
jgi:polar amino acid transport system substrate-binding protein